MLLGFSGFLGGFCWILSVFFLVAHCCLPHCTCCLLWVLLLQIHIWFLPALPAGFSHIVWVFAMPGFPARLEQILPGWFCCICIVLISFSYLLHFSFCIFWSTFHSHSYISATTILPVPTIPAILPFLLYLFIHFIFISFHKISTDLDLQISTYLCLELRSACCSCATVSGRSGRCRFLPAPAVWVWVLLPASSASTSPASCHFIPQIWVWVSGTAFFSACSYYSSGSMDILCFSATCSGFLYFMLDFSGFLLSACLEWSSLPACLYYSSPAFLHSVSSSCMALPFYHHLHLSIHCWGGGGSFWWVGLVVDVHSVDANVS